MPGPAWLLPTLISSAVGIGGGLSGRKKTQITRPFFSPADEAFSDILRSRLQTRFDEPVPLEGFEATGLQNINQTFDPITAALNARLTSRGLGTSPVAAAAETKLETARGGEIARFLNSLPLLRRDLATQDLGLAAHFLTARRGQATQIPGDVAGSALSSAGTIMAFLAGMGAFGAKD